MLAADLNVILPEIILAVFAMLALLAAVYSSKDDMAPTLVWLTASKVPIVGMAASVRLYASTRSSLTSTKRFIYQRMTRSGFY